MDALDPATWTGRPVLLVAPHADDEVLGCGGTLAIAAAAGAHVHVVVLACASPGIDGSARAEERAEEARAACGFLGLSPPVLIGATSEALRADPAAAGARLSTLFAGHPFEVVLAPWPLERHPTHRAALLAATVGVPAAPKARWYGYGVWDPLPAGRGTVEVDVSGVRAAKTRALGAHASQHGARPLTAGMTSRDLAQAVFSRLTGAEPRKAVERLIDLGDLPGRLAAACGPQAAPGALAGVVADWAAAHVREQAEGLWSD